MTFTTTDRQKLIEALKTAMELAQLLPVTPKPKTPAPKASKPEKPKKVALDRIMGNERMVHETLDDPNSDSYQDVPNKQYLEKLLENLTGSKSKPGTSIQIRRRLELHSPDPWDSKDEAQSETDSIVPTKKKTNKSSGSRTSNAAVSSSNATGRGRLKGKHRNETEAKDSVVDGMQSLLHKNMSNSL
ncbi:hypothetical protein B0H14DRAFT_3065933 [Mycena olivaceomarginata]|nr:hypothetical protein B0H14DRAFT_3065933 [Mycena olivaceomarginata]